MSAERDCRVPYQVKRWKRFNSNNKNWYIDKAVTCLRPERRGGIPLEVKQSHCECESIGNVCSLGNSDQNADMKARQDGACLEPYVPPCLLKINIKSTEGLSLIDIDEISECFEQVNRETHEHIRLLFVHDTSVADNGQPQMTSNRENVTTFANDRQVQMLRRGGLQDRDVKRVFLHYITCVR